jgi:hypothetical protein
MKKDGPRIYHVDWDLRVLSRTETLPEEAAEMPPQGVMFEKLLAQGDAVVTVFCTHHPRNKIPDSMMQHEVGTLKWSNKFSMPDFGIDESGVYGSLSFSSKLHFVYISWDSIMEITGTPSGASAIWPSLQKGADLT